MRYEIGGLLFDLGMENEISYIDSRMSIFQSSKGSNSHISADFFRKKCINKPEGSALLSEDASINWFSKTNGAEGFYGYITSYTTGEILDLLDTDSAWSHANIFLLNSFKLTGQLTDLTSILAFQLLGAMFRTRILFHEGIVIHASSIEWEGKGILFSAPSGTGKSTQARNWVKYMGEKVRILNDDSPAVRIISGQPYIFGTPWSGSSDKFLNTCARLYAIVMLEQSGENSIHALSPEETIVRLMPRCFLPYFDRSLMDMAVNVLENIIKRTPVYLLKCRPDREAVELVCQCVM